MKSNHSTTRMSLISVFVAIMLVLTFVHVSAQTPPDSEDPPSNPDHRVPWDQLPPETQGAIRDTVQQQLADLDGDFAQAWDTATGLTMDAIHELVPMLWDALLETHEQTSDGSAMTEEDLLILAATATQSVIESLPEDSEINLPTPDEVTAQCKSSGDGPYIPYWSIVFLVNCLMLGILILPILVAVIVATIAIAVALALVLAAEAMAQALLLILTTTANDILYDVDGNNDTLGDTYQQAWGIVNAPDDLDSDGLDNLGEFRWNLVPICRPGNQNCRDYESSASNGAGGDNWLDGPEVHYWNNSTNDFIFDVAASGILGPIALFDPDHLVDSDGDGLTDVGDPDADNDGLLDGDEYNLYGSYPELADSDCLANATECTPSTATTLHGERQGGPGAGDGIPDKLERDAWDALGPGKRTTDFDGDGISNNLLDPDADGDGLTDGDEFNLGKGQVRPDRRDTDGDGLLDGDETAWNEDTDLDGLLNANDPDSDNDGMPDGWERANGFNMVDPTDALLDADADGLSNLGEYQHGTYPRDPDSEGDELQDGQEVLQEGTNPFHWDTDGDGLPDAWEARYKLMGTVVAANPKVADASFDGDNDRSAAPWCSNIGAAFNNRAEYLFGIPAGWDSRPVRLGGDGVWWDGTAPNNPDSDGDGMTDGYEVCSGTDAKQADVLGDGDADADGLANAAEIPAGTRYDDPDTDGDGLCDGGRGASCTGRSGTHQPGEVLDYRSNPLAADTDGDGWLDGPEALYWDAAGVGRVPDSDGDGISNLHEPDSDADGWTDLQEYQSQQGPEGTDPGNPDPDNDGLLDPLEKQGWDVCQERLWSTTRTFMGCISGYRRVTSNPQLRDTDMDGLSDLEERQRLIDPRNSDSDGDGLTDAQETAGWAVIVNGVVRNVTSDPLSSDADSDFLTDFLEFSLGTDPWSRDTDADGLTDAQEDEDRDGVSSEGETSPLDADSDDDGLLDGAEHHLHGTDPLAADSDEDGLNDFEEVSIYLTNPLLEDTDGDFLPDGEEVGALQAGGTPDRITSALNPDTDGDGLKDGEEVYFYGTDPRVADSDCDGLADGVDPNPYKSNVPPSWARPAQDRLCPSAPTGSMDIGMPDAPNLPGLSVLSASTEQADNGDIGLLVFDEDGLVTILARLPDSEAPITVVHALVSLDGQVRVDAAGTLAGGSAHLSAELHPIDEPGVETTGNPYTHAVRVPLPEGMVTATAATYALTFLDQNLNSATYTGQVSGFQLNEVEYHDELTPADEQDLDDPSDSAQGWSGWDYVRSNVTGGEADPSTPPTSSLGGQGLLSNNASASLSGESRVWIFRIVQPAVPTLVGGIVDGVLVLAPPSNTTVPVRSILFTDTVVEVDPEDYDEFTSAKWWKPLVKAAKKVVQATSKAWTAGVTVSNAVDAVFNKAGQEVKRNTQMLYDEVKNPRSPAAFGARFVLDVVGVGDVISIVEGVRQGDWTQVAFGVAGLALTMVPMIKGPVLAAKASFTLAKAAGASDELFMLLGRSLENSARLPTPTSAAHIERTSDVLSVVAGKGKESLDGLGVLAKVRGTDPLGVEKVADSTLASGFLGKQVTTKTKAAAEETAKVYARSSQVPVNLAAKVATKTDKYATHEPLFIDSLTKLVDANSPGVGSLASSALHMAPKQGKGMAYTVVKSAENIGKPGHSLEFTHTLANGKVLKPDETFLEDGFRIYRENKNYDGVFSLNTFNKQQLKNYAGMVDERGGKVQYIIENGQVSKGVKDLVKQLNDAYPPKIRIELLNDAGIPIP